MKRLLSAYAIVAPLVLTPLSAWLWWRSCGGHAALFSLAWGLPIAWAYIVPGIGTNVLKMWEFDTRLRLGRFRLQHGFVFGSATAMLGWLVHAGPARDWADVARLAFVMASVLGFWNLLYEVKALEAGVLRVYNQPWAEGQSEPAVAMDYAPWFFAGFGAVYGFALGAVELHADALRETSAAVLVWTLALMLACTLPVAGYMHRSWRRHGHLGTRPFSSQDVGKPVSARVREPASDSAQGAVREDRGATAAEPSRESP